VAAWANENTNIFFKQYFSKEFYLTDCSQCQLDPVANRPDARPRETLDNDTAAQRFERCIPSTILIRNRWLNLGKQRYNGIEPWDPHSMGMAVL
jgi:hypothetical protein